MKLRPHLLTGLVILLSFAVNTHARYITEHQQLHEIIGTHTLTDFDNYFISLEAALPTVLFDRSLELTDVDRLTFTITGTISPVTVCGDGIIRPDECYIVNAGVDHMWAPYGLIKAGGISDPTGSFSDDDPAFEQKWVYDDPGKPLIEPILRGVDCDTGLCGGWENTDEVSVVPTSRISDIRFAAGPLTRELISIPYLNDPDPCLPPDLCPVPLIELPFCISLECIFPPIARSAAAGLHVVGSIELTITDAYITREWNIPEPASLALLLAGAVAVIRRKK